MSGHYEEDEDYEDPYWYPSSVEDELRMQLVNLKVQEIPREDLQWVEKISSLLIWLGLSIILERLQANTTH